MRRKDCSLWVRLQLLRLSHCRVTQLGDPVSSSMKPQYQEERLRQSCCGNDVSNACKVLSMVSGTKTLNCKELPGPSLTPQIKPSVSSTSNRPIAMSDYTTIKWKKKNRKKTGKKEEKINFFQFSKLYPNKCGIKKESKVDFRMSEIEKVI